MPNQFNDIKISPLTQEDITLPPGIRQLIDTPTVGLQPSALAIPRQPMVGEEAVIYEQGGMLPLPQGAPQGQPQAGIALGAAGAAAPGPVGNPEEIAPQVDEMMGQNPELVARIRAGIEAGIQSGEITQEELTMATELGQVVAQNPDMYPHVRQRLIEDGVLGEEDLPQQYDPGLVATVLMVANAMKAQVQFPGQQAGTAQQAPVQELENGGMIDGPSHDKGGVRARMPDGHEVEVEGGEYVIPRDVVLRKGTEFFDKLLEPPTAKKPAAEG